MKEMNITPNKMLIGYVLQSAMKQNDTSLIIEALEKFVEIKHEPDKRLIKNLSAIENMPDRLFVILHKNF